MSGSDEGPERELRPERALAPFAGSRRRGQGAESERAVRVHRGAIIGTSLNQTGRPVENIAIMMAFFLTISILISLFMNWYNKRIALVER